MMGPMRMRRTNYLNDLSACWKKVVVNVRFTEMMMKYFKWRFGG